MCRIRISSLGDSDVTVAWVRLELFASAVSDARLRAAAESLADAGVLALFDSPQVISRHDGVAHTGFGSRTMGTTKT